MYICPPRSQPRISLGQIPKGYAGTKKTVAYITGLVKEGAKDFCVRQTAIAILFHNGVPPKDYLGEIRTLFVWVQNNVRYTRDIHRVELLHSARRMLELQAGDCDDMTILLAAMLKAIGLKRCLLRLDTILGGCSSNGKFSGGGRGGIEDCSIA